MPRWNSLIKRSFTRRITRPLSQYFISPTSASVNEGSSILFDITTKNVIDGTTLYWVNTGTTTANDFTQNQNTGTVTINNNYGNVSLTLTNDYSFLEGNETLILQLRTGSITGTIVANASSIVVSDTSASGEFTQLDILAIAGGGGVGGSDGPFGGSTGGGGAAIIGTYSYSRLTNLSWDITVGSAGGAGCMFCGASGGGTPGGGGGGGQGPSGGSGSGGGGGGWTGIYSGGTKLIIAGAGGGGTGAGYPSAGAVAGSGGGVQPRGNTGTMNGSNGQTPGSGDYGGGGGGGGGWYGGTGASGGASPNSASGGGNYYNSTFIGNVSVTNGSNSGAAPTITFTGYSGTYGESNTQGVVVIRYFGPQIATGGTVTTTGNSTVHTFTTSGSFVITSF